MRGPGGLRWLAIVLSSEQRFELHGYHERLGGKHYVGKHDIDERKRPGSVLSSIERSVLHR